MLTDKLMELFECSYSDLDVLNESELYDDCKGKFKLWVKSLASSAAKENNDIEFVEAYKEWLDDQYYTLLAERPSSNTRVFYIKEIIPKLASGTWIGGIDIYTKRDKVKNKDDLLEFFQLKNERLTEYDYKHPENLNTIFALLLSNSSRIRLKACSLKKSYQNEIIKAIKNDVWGGEFTYRRTKIYWEWKPQLILHTHENKKVRWGDLDTEAQKRILKEAINEPFMWGSFLTGVPRAKTHAA